MVDERARAVVTKLGVKVYSYAEDVAPQASGCGRMSVNGSYRR
jgi:hypothetical protein